MASKRATVGVSRSVLEPYVDHLNKILNQTVTKSRLSIVQGPAPAYFVIDRFEGGNPYGLELKPKGRWLHIRQGVSVRWREKDGRFRVIVHSAWYTYSTSGDPANEAAKLFMYHYNRDGATNQPQSHYHVCADGADGNSIKRIHFPTGRISIEQIVAHLLTDRGVQPLCDLELAMSRLKGSHARFIGSLRTDEPLFP